VHLRRLALPSFVSLGQPVEFDDFIAASKTFRHVPDPRFKSTEHSI
jgi:hypothetical protein